MNRDQDLTPEDDPVGAAIHEVYEAIYRLFDIDSRESAHWHSTVAIINADRATRSGHSDAKMSARGSPFPEKSHVAVRGGTVNADWQPATTEGLSR